jgi:hypothetical protein
LKVNNLLDARTKISTKVIKKRRQTLALGRGTGCSKNGTNARNVKETRLGTSICGISARSGGFVGRGKGEKKEGGEIRETRKMAR